MSVNSTNPATLFGGTWEKMSGGFLYGAVNSIGNGNGTGTATAGNNGNTGSTTLTVEQIPSHNHIQTFGSSIAIAGAGSYHDNARVDGEYNATPSKANAYRQITVNTGGGKGHTHTLNNHIHNIPYMAVWVWKRTA